jgi:ligand-binding SRPBCC domain-containing protein
MPMPRIHLTTFIQSPPQRVFDLCRHLSLIKKSVLGKNESIMSSAGSTMVTNGDTITYHAKHLGKMRSVMLRITEFEKGHKLTEEQVKGDLINYRHEHFFKQIDNGTIMIDIVEYDLPKDFIGKWAGKFFLREYLEKIIKNRILIVKNYAETERWHALLG